MVLLRFFVSSRHAVFVVALLAFATIAHADASPEEAEFLKQAEKTRTAVASAHVALAKSARKAGLNVAARAELDAALELAPEFKDAMEELGYRRKKVDGEDKWVADERRALPEKDAESATPAARKKHADARDKMRREAAIEFVKLGKTGQRLALAPHARAAFEVALRYDPANEEALTGAGWAKVDGVWLSPAEQREADATRKALEVGTKALDQLPDWSARVFQQGAWGLTGGGVELLGTGAMHEALTKHAAAVLSLSGRLLGGDATLRVVACASRDDFRRYCEVRHPGAPGLADGWMVVAGTEIGVLITDQREESLERVAYAAALSQVRKRCGEARFTWFEVGYAATMAHRLTGRVSCIEFSGEPTGPKEHGRFKRQLRQQLEAGSAPELEYVVADRDPDESRAIVAYFFVKYLCREKAAGLPPFCAAFKAEGDSEAALRLAYDSDVAALERSFLDWFGR
ncbi:MAG: hypothetical protein KF696_03515 [Planctomycetes bacterium]|nr:hypothetical protein [Planctomycetota bacterium]MCW8134037.1 hypothetical protein [Planctomycetota bacterium]